MGAPLLSWLVRSCLRRRTVVLAGALALCVYGVVAAVRLPIDVLPDVDRPTVSILAEAPGLAPEDVEAQVTAPIESAVLGSAGVRRVSSSSRPGLAIVRVELEWGADVQRSRQMVQERLVEARGRLPASVSAHVGPIASIMGEIMLVGVRSDTLTPLQMRDVADWTLRPALLAVPGVAQVTVMGGAVRELRVSADPDKLRLYEVTLADLERALSEAARGLEGAASGALVAGPTELLVRNGGSGVGPEEVGAWLVASRSGTGGRVVPVRVRDVARVEEGPAPMGRMVGDASVMGRPGVILAVSKQAGADTVAVTREIDLRLVAMRGSLPEGVSIEPDLFRQADFVERSVGNVLDALRDGAVLVVIVLALFLVDVRATAVALAAMPISILCTLVVLRIMGETANTMTLGGIAIGVGELVDDAVVGVENMHRRLRARSAAGASGDALRVIARATSEVRGPILVSTTIVMLVLLPLLLLPDVAGRLFTPLAWAYVVSIFVSMAVSLTVTPALASCVLAGEGRGERARGDGLVLRACKRAALWAYGVSTPRAGMTLVVCAVLLVASIVAVGRLGREFLPAFNEGTAVVTLTGAPGMSLAESGRIGRVAEEIVLGVPEVQRVARRTGRAENDEHALGVHVTEMEVDFFGAGKPERPRGAERAAPERVRPLDAVFAELRERLGELPGIAVSIGQPIGHRLEHLESGVRAPIVVKVRGPELERLGMVAERAASLMSRVPGVVDIVSEREAGAPRLDVRVDAERAGSFGFTPGEARAAVRTVAQGTVVGRVYNRDRSCGLVLGIDDRWLGSLAEGSSGSAAGAVRDAPLLSPSGAVALVSDVADVRVGVGASTIGRENGVRCVMVSCGVRGEDPAGVAAAIEGALARELRTPDGYTVTVEGQFQSRARAAQVIGMLGAASLLVMFGLLRWYLGGWLLAVQVMLNIPFACIGAGAAMWLAREPLSLASMVGLIGLCGIATRNGVLMISHYQRLMTECGGALSRELVVRGSQERVAPVLMTALTTGLATLPIVLWPHAPGREILHPIALVVCGGLVSATLLDFFVTPAVFLRFSGAGAGFASEHPRRRGVGIGERGGDQ